ncbi:hypothetical protein A1QO_03975 [Vibrio genomosp. F10 str. ZF-129]|uniref:Uncharacterized protein n=1 Tax=Vibrio genomosp. F10 str. ZF-129 TaxID=1187848 RepID=A0A1E5BIJ9_9VIBR|nr:hypothetical protein [Vibrio genomosp. F10]OEE37269.1 hypothetical protein A1QO_03975 [Vibrio genomosp. F10 str. ZF-129]
MNYKAKAIASYLNKSGWAMREQNNQVTVMNKNISLHGLDDSETLDVEVTYDVRTNKLTMVTSLNHSDENEALEMHWDAYFCLYNRHDNSEMVKRLNLIIKHNLSKQLSTVIEDLYPILEHEYTEASKVDLEIRIFRKDNHNSATFRKAYSMQEHFDGLPNSHGKAIAAKIFPDDHYVVHVDALENLNLESALRREFQIPTRNHIIRKIHSPLQSAFKGYEPHSFSNESILVKRVTVGLCYAEVNKEWEQEYSNSQYQNALGKLPNNFVEDTEAIQYNEEKTKYYLKEGIGPVYLKDTTSGLSIFSVVEGEKSTYEPWRLIGSEIKEVCDEQQISLLPHGPEFDLFLSQLIFQPAKIDGQVNFDCPLAIELLGADPDHPAWNDTDIVYHPGTGTHFTYNRVDKEYSTAVTHDIYCSKSLRIAAIGIFEWSLIECDYLQMIYKNWPSYD